MGGVRAKFTLLIENAAAEAYSLGLLEAYSDEREYDSDDIVTLLEAAEAAAAPGVAEQQ